jgi:gluconokinase
MAGGNPHGLAIVVMGVSAAGKSSVGQCLAARLAVPFVDADALHPAVSVAKMTAGRSLDDNDRWPWLDRVGATLESASADAGVVVACSALRRVHRDRLRHSCPHAVFVHLTGSRAVLASRAAERQDHFMPAALLPSQLATLEPLQADERGWEVDITPPIDDIAAEAQRRILAHV